MAVVIYLGEEKRVERAHKEEVEGGGRGEMLRKRRRDER